MLPYETAIDRMEVQRDFEIKDGSGVTVTVTIKGAQLVDRLSSINENSKNAFILILEGKLRSEESDKFIFVDSRNASCEVRALYCFTFKLKCKIALLILNYLEIFHFSY